MKMFTNPRTVVMHDWQFYNYGKKIAGRIGKMQVAAPIMERTKKGMRIGTERSNLTVTLK